MNARRQKMADVLAHWHRLAPWKQRVALGFIGLLSLYLPAQHAWEQHSRMVRAEQQWQETQEKLTHQQKILTALKEKSEKQLLTPALADKLPPINRQIQQLAHRLQIDQSQWDFHQNPLLRLQLQGHFNDLQAFLTALLKSNTALELVEWQVVQHSEANEIASIQSELLFQLHSTENEGK